MKKTLILLTAFFLAASITVSAQATEEKKDRVIASYLIAFGVLPEQGEIDYWINTSYASQPLSALLGEHKKNIANNQTLQDRAIRNSYQDALGRVPAQSEIETWRPLKLSYADLMGRHMQFLKDYPAEFENVIKLTYRKEFNREAQATEVSNWRSWGVRAYFAIIQEHQKNRKAGMFAQSNQGANKVSQSEKSGIFVRISPKIASEIKTTGGSFVSTNSGTWISTNSGNIISTDGAGFGAGGGKLIGQAGGN
jgi:hypothetical protein